MAKLKHERLADFYLPIMQDLRNLLPKAETAPDLAKTLKDLIDQANSTALATNYQQDDITAAQFALVAWIDEQAMSYNWSGASAWRLTPLQRYYFSTTRAGSEFYQRLDALDVSNTQVREVYALALIAGFQGEKGTRSRQDLLLYSRKLIESLRQKDNHAGVSRQQPLFPAAAVQKELYGTSDIKRKPALISALIIGVPIIILIAYYFYLDFSLSQAVAELIGAK